MKKTCEVCGKQLVRQTRYCSKKCMGIGKQGYKICPSCGKQFKSPACDMTVCCSPQCSKKHRQELYKNGVYTESVSKMRAGFAQKVKDDGPENFWKSKGWVIQSPSGQIYECRNLMNFIRENPDLFDGTPKQMYDGFRKMKASQEGKTKYHYYSCKGWKLISWSD